MRKIKKLVFYIIILVIIIHSKTNLAKENKNNILFTLSPTNSSVESDNIIKKKQSLTNINHEKIQPGTSGYFDIIIDSNNYFSNFNYKVLFSEEKNKPRNLIFFVDNTQNNYLEKINIEGKMPKQSCQTVKRIYWNWEYESKNASDEIDNDEIDTQDSQNDYEFYTTLLIEKDLPEAKLKLPRTGIMKIGVISLILKTIMTIIIIYLGKIIKNKLNNQKGGKNHIENYKNIN
ncbi:MAG: hypothetical protein IKG14_03630 [Clostridia bacterium]|nr:hypothetical protein [Clostridia bacterium]